MKPRKAALFLGIAALTTVQKINAQVNCDALILDNASVLSSADRARIEIESSPLRAQGANVHIFTFFASNDKSPAEMVRNTIAACSSWQTWTGEANEQLILLAVSPDSHSQETSVLYGVGWSPALDNHVDAISKAHLKPHVADHHLADGFIETERAIRSQIAVYQQVEKEKSRKRNHWFRLVGLLLAAICTVFLARKWFAIQRKREAENLANAEFQYGFHEWIDDELIKLNIQMLRDCNEHQQYLHRQLEEAKHATTFSREQAEKQWMELRRLLGDS